ncbi:Gfo/Idh/MocA family protein [Parapedobacter sp. 10938]|uniref:Gfo/Idh/MocA family protein n=1 Tax=Parapedobacter flavus TaxID=3110225 RepID=UPI002DBB5CFC|nr:Gfo/Idh/MocA family oxidoreductase [Parapedobacter sp. 10938]MEC3878450.1 Gfo/Idh/MocA family oxidoreductase [Parapedobacter sp. 10938]
MANNSESGASPLEHQPENPNTSRRSFLSTLGLGVASLGLAQMGCSAQKKTAGSPTASNGKVISGFDEQGKETVDLHAGWEPVSDRKVRVGLVGYGLCKFAAAFGFQDHPNVEIVAVSDLYPDRCDGLAKAARCDKKYPSLEEMVKDDHIEAIFVATDAPSHARHAILALNHGKHVAVAVPAVFGTLEEADELYNAVKRSGKKYMMFETSCFREDLYAMRKIYQAGGFGEIVYSEGEYIHYGSKPLSSYNGWRDGNPPMFYLTHATAYYVGVTGGHFTDVSCYGKKSHLDYLKGGNNRYHNPYGTQIAMFEADNGSISRMLYSKDTPGSGGEVGRLRGELGSYSREIKYKGKMEDNLPQTKRPPLPPGVKPGGHGGAHGHLTEEFIQSILEDRQPWVNVALSLNMSVPGIIAHQSCLKGGESLKIPYYTMWS